MPSTTWTFVNATARGRSVVDKQATPTTPTTATTATSATTTTATMARRVAAACRQNANFLLLRFEA